MPPKPPLRIPKKPPPIPSPRNAFPSTKLVKPVPRSSTKADTPPPTAAIEAPITSKWYEQSHARSGARYVIWSTNIILIWCTAVWVRDHHIRFDAIQGSSMAPTINPSAHETGKRDWVFFTPYWHWNTRKQDAGSNTDSIQESAGGIKRGDVVTFWKPHKPEEVSIKRVVAIEGDTVYPKRGYALDPHVYFGDSRLKGMPDGIPDIDQDSVLAGTEQLGRIVVPYGYIWVEGDNARKSLDSNDFGPISRALVKERAVWIWRGWGEFLRVGDGRSRRERNLGSRVVEGRSEVPRVFVE